MDDVVRVQVGDAVEDLLDDVSRVELVVVYLLDEAVKELAAPAEVSDDENALLRLVEVPHLDDVGVLDTVEDLDFLSARVRREAYQLCS